VTDDGAGGGRVVAVLGYSNRRSQGLHPICVARLSRAELVAPGARAVILSGWARRTKAKPEAELMRAAWAGPEVPLVSDPDARTTVQNAANVAAAARALGADELVVVTSRWHRRRAEALVRTALGDAGVRVSVEEAEGTASPALLLRELACLAALPLQRRRVRRRSRARPSSGIPAG